MAKKYHSCWKNRKGLSLLELIVSLAIGGIVTMLLLDASKNIVKSKDKFEIVVSEDAQKIFGEFVLTSDLTKAVHSFNQLGPCRSSGQDPYGLYDFDPAAPSCHGANPPADCAPKVRLTVAEGESASAASVVFLVARNGTLENSNNVKSALRTINPTEIYEMDGPPSGPQALFTSGALAFDEDRLKDKLADFQMMDNGMVLRFYSPYQARAINSGGNDFDYSVPPRSISVMAYVTGGTLETAPPAFMQCQKSYDFDATVNLMDTSPAGFPRMDAFFRLLPPRAGRENFAMVANVVARRYRLYRTQNVRNTKPFELVSSDWSPEAACTGEGCEVGSCRPGVSCRPGTWVNRRTVIFDIARNFEFRRKSVRVPSFTFAKDVP